MLEKGWKRESVRLAENAHTHYIINNLLAYNCADRYDSNSWSMRS